MDLKEIDITTPEHVSLSFKMAGLGSRATAHILDLLILGIINTALTSLLMLFKEKLKILTDLSGYALAGLIISVFILWWGYFVLFEFFAGGQTPGKMLIGIRVIQDNGQSVTFLSTAVRNLFRLIDFLPLLYLLGILMIFFHPKHKRIGDLTAGTIVVYQQKIKLRKKRGLTQRNKEEIKLRRVELEEWSKKRIGIREWKLLKTYVERRKSLSKRDLKELTVKVAGIVFPLIDMDIAQQSVEDMEEILLELYDILRDDWEFKR